MKGLDLCEKYYFEAVKPLIEKSYPELINKFSGGLIGYGSDVLGNDDELSRDHEWGPRCHIWLTNEDYNQYAEDIQKLLNDYLPLEFEGFNTMFKYSEEFSCLVTSNSRESSFCHVAITNVERHMKIQFGIEKINGEYAITDTGWLCIPEQKLIELTRGRIFEDNIGEITKVREMFSYYPEYIRKYKIVYCWDQIDEVRLIPLDFKRGNVIGGNVILNRVLENVVRLTYLYNRQYYPGYLKWFGYKFSELSVIASDIEKYILQCYKTDDIDIIMKNIKKIIETLIKEHNNQRISMAELKESSTGRNLFNFTVNHIGRDILETLPENMQQLGMGGSCDLWITNADILIWAEKYKQFEELYKNNYFNERSGVGDMMI